MLQVNSHIRQNKDLVEQNNNYLRENRNFVANQKFKSVLKTQGFAEADIRAAYKFETELLTFKKIRENTGTRNEEVAMEHILLQCFDGDAQTEINNTLKTENISTFDELISWIDDRYEIYNMYDIVVSEIKAIKANDVKFNGIAFVRQFKRAFELLDQIIEADNVRDTRDLELTVKKRMELVFKATDLHRISIASLKCRFV